MNHNPITVQIEAFGDLYFHGIATDQRWNGFACPLFSFEEANRLTMINNETAGAGYLEFDSELDAYHFWQDGHDQTKTPDVYAAIEISGKNYYAIGAFSWCWSICDDNTSRFSSQLLLELRVC